MTAAKHVTTIKLLTLALVVSDYYQKRSKKLFSESETKKRTFNSNLAIIDNLTLTG